MRCLRERSLRVVTDGDIRKPRDLGVRLSLGLERAADLGRELLHVLGADGDEDEAVGDPRRPLDRLGLQRTRPYRRPGLLYERRPEDAVIAVRLARGLPDFADSCDLPLEPLRAALELRLENFEVVLAAALRETEDEAAAGELVHDGRLLRDQHLVPRRQLQDR